MDYDDLIKSMEFDRKVKKLQEMWEEQRQEDIAWMEAAYG
jgi:hypothetical protein